MIIDFHKGQGGGGEYHLPIASATELGGIKVGANLEIDADGVLGVTGLEDKEDNTNKVTTIASTSTDTEYPSAKSVYTYVQAQIGNINNELDTI